MNSKKTGLKNFFFVFVVGKYFVNSLSDRDSVGVVAISSEIRLATVEACPNGGFANATADTKFSFTRFLDYLEKGEGLFCCILS